MAHLKTLYLGHKKNHKKYTRVIATERAWRFQEQEWQFIFYVKDSYIGGASKIFGGVVLVKVMKEGVVQILRTISKIDEPTHYKNNLDMIDQILNAKNFKPEGKPTILKKTVSFSGRTPPYRDLHLLELRLDKKSYGSKGPVKIFIKKRNIPKGAGLVLYVERVPRIRHWVRFSKTIGGPLMLVPMRIDGSGEKVFEWTEGKVGHAPTDFPYWNKRGMEPGTYQIVAKLYNTANFGFLGWPDRNFKHVIDEVKSEVFKIEGKEDFTAFKSASLYKPLQHLVNDLKVPHGGGSDATKYFTAIGEPKKQGKDYCLTYQFKPPFKGKMVTCGPLHPAPSDIYAEGKAESIADKTVPK